MTETDTRPALVGEQDDDPSVVARARDPHLEVLANPADVRMPNRGSAGQRIATARSSS